MATVTGLTAARMIEIEAASVVDGVIVGDDLILTRYDGSTINAGDVRGPQGPIGSSSDTAVVIATSGTRPAMPYAGLYVYETDTDFVYRWNGSAWVYVGGTIICTSGTRPAVPFTGLEIYETDTKRPYTYNGTIWVYTGGDVICTSSTRPSSPFTGLAIFETDTKKAYVWTGSEWFNPNSPMRCKVYRNAAQSIPTATTTPIVWTTEDYDTSGIWSSGGTADSFVMPANSDGDWRFCLNGNYSVNANGARVFGIMLNGSPVATSNTLANASWLVGGTVSIDLTVEAGDVIKAFAYHTAGVAVNLDVSYPLSFSAVLLARA